MKEAKVSRGVSRRDRSAGVIVFRRTRWGRRFLLLDYGRYWDFPKGHVEKGEDDRAAALRELAEETGIGNASIIPDFAEEIVYFFRDRSGGLIRKAVVFFLASTTTAKVVVSHEHAGFAWLSAEEALGRLKYPTARQVFRAALAFLESTDRSVAG